VMIIFVTKTGLWVGLHGFGLLRDDPDMSQTVTFIKERRQI
jgi:hypothetical protein